MKIADIGLLGLAVMGENLALNMESKGFTVAVYNRSFPGEEGVVDRFVNGRGKGKNFIPAHSIEELVEAVKRPRVIMMMIKAGAPVDEMIEQLLPHMSPGDVIIDGGNSDFHDTERRVKEVEAKGLYFVGSGISGPSVMPGGSPEAWPIVKEKLQGIAAKPDDGTPCCQWIGAGGAGHFVKMVHNGIEYGDMQLISEAYSLLKNRKGLDDDEMAVVFEEWNKGELDSFLIEITKNIKYIQSAVYYSAALMRNGDLWTWGSMAKGESYSSSKVSQDTEQKSAVFMTDVKEFVLGTNCYAAIKNDGSLYAWGDNSFGAIGIGKAPNIDYSENSNDYAEPVPVKVVDNVKAVTHDSVNRMMYLKNNGSLWAAGSGKYGVLSELDEENSTQYNFYRNPILITLITLKGKSPSLTVKDDNNSGTTDPEEPDSGDIDDGDHGHDHGNKDNAGDKQQDQVGGQIKPSIQQQRNLLPQQQSQFLEQIS